VLADIALRSLSPAINDPTTAVQALDDRPLGCHPEGGVEVVPRAAVAPAGDTSEP
jgi:hypothetical protein